MVVNARKAAGVINPNTGDVMELDIYMPSLNLGFEYQVGQVFLFGEGGGGEKGYKVARNSFAFLLRNCIITQALIMLMSRYPLLLKEMRSRRTWWPLKA